ncbi:MAG: TetR/AcrR family transcriptional regulator [Cyclobacteriaceae bacterium]|nr:TetR/AcrR family transcriptional regulator [Cyclobacteriaceae bacterium]
MAKHKAKLLNSEKSQQLLKVSLDLFLEKGFENVTVRDIVTAANSSMGNLYFHFDNKLDILRFISRKYLDTLQEKTQSNLELPYDPHIKFCIDLKGGLITTLEDPKLSKLFLLVRELPEMRKHSIENKKHRLQTFFKNKHSEEEAKTLAVALQGISDAFFKIRFEEYLEIPVNQFSNQIIKYNLLLLGYSKPEVENAIKTVDQYFRENTYRLSFDQVIESML